MLLGFWNQRAVRIFQQERLEFILGKLRLRVIAVRFFHHAEVRHADLHLGVRGFIEERKESFEILVGFDRLRQVRSPAFFVEGIADCEFRFGEKFAVGISIDQRLQVETRFGVLPVLEIRHRAVVKNLVRLRRTRGLSSRSGLLFLFGVFCIISGESGAGEKSEGQPCGERESKFPGYCFHHTFCVKASCARSRICRNAAAGSGVLKMDVPATSVSAPARTNSARFSSPTPPSTSIR